MNPTEQFDLEKKENIINLAKDRRIKETAMSFIIDSAVN